MWIGSGVDRAERSGNRAGVGPFYGKLKGEIFMTSHPPPVPPDQRPKAGPKDSGKTSVADESGSFGLADGNLAEQGRAGNTKQNTTNKGLQQDR